MTPNKSIAANKKARETGELGRWCVVNIDSWEPEFVLVTLIMRGEYFDCLHDDGSAGSDMIVTDDNILATDEEIKQFYERLNDEK